jgi:hypothetical protein
MMESEERTRGKLKKKTTENDLKQYSSRGPRPQQIFLVAARTSNGKIALAGAQKPSH